MKENKKVDYSEYFLSLFRIKEYLLQIAFLNDKIKDKDLIILFGAELLARTEEIETKINIAKILLDDVNQKSYYGIQVLDICNKIERIISELPENNMFSDEEEFIIERYLSVHQLARNEYELTDKTKKVLCEFIESNGNLEEE